jgi:uncharacterized protein YuzE
MASLEPIAETIKVYFDPEGDFLEVTFERKLGYVRDTDDDRVMIRVDMEGRTIGFSILNVSSLKGSPFEVSLTG